MRQNDSRSQFYTDKIPRSRTFFKTVSLSRFLSCRHSSSACSVNASSFPVLFRNVILSGETWEKDDLERVLRNLLSTPDNGRVPYLPVKFAAADHTPEQDRMRLYADVYQIAEEPGVDMIADWA